MKKIILSILFLFVQPLNAEQIDIEKLFNEALQKSSEKKKSLLIEIINQTNTNISSEKTRDYIRQSFMLLLKEEQKEEIKYALKIKFLDFCRQLYKTSTNIEEKKIITENLLSLLNYFTEKYLEENNWSKVSELIQEQIPLYYFLKKDPKDLIKQKTKITYYLSLTNKINKYKELIQTNPKNILIKTELIKIFVIDLDDIETAKKYVVDKTPNFWKDNLNLLDKIDNDSLLKLGKWYENLSKQTSFNKEKMLNKSLNYYKQINTIESKENIKRIENILWSLKHNSPSPNQIFEFVGKTSPGLIIKEYPMAKEQRDKNNIIDISLFSDPVKISKTDRFGLDPWKHGWHPITRNAIAYGYLKILISGEYSFVTSSFYNFCGLYIDGKKVTPSKITKFILQKGYIRIASIGYVRNRGSVLVKWIPPGKLELSSIPFQLLYHSENDVITKLPMIERK